MVVLATDAQESRNALRPSVQQVWQWLAEVPDPEIPVVSVVDLGIVRGVAWSKADDASEADDAMLLVTVTPTYSGCPATEVISRDVREHLLARGLPRVQLRVQLSPAWTTDWLSASAKEKLRVFGIAPPTELAANMENGFASALVVLGQGESAPPPACPRCGSANTEMISRFGSTPCKSLHRCLACLEPFDQFKCH